MSSYPFGQTAVTAEWLIFDVRDADGNVETYTREIADRVGIDRRNTELKIRGLLPELITSEALTKFGMAAPSLVNALDDHTIYFSPSLMSAEYAAHVGENLLTAAPRVLEVQAVATGLPDIWNVLLGDGDVEGAADNCLVAVESGNQRGDRRERGWHAPDSRRRGGWCLLCAPGQCSWKNRSGQGCKHNYDQGLGAARFCKRDRIWSSTFELTWPKLLTIID